MLCIRCIKQATKGTETEAQQVSRLAREERS